MKVETLKGYLHIPAAGTPVVAYAKGVATVAEAAAVRGDDRRQKDRAAAVKAAAEGAQPGLYHARVIVSRADHTWKVERARPVASLSDEIRRLDAQARRKDGKVVTEREVKRSRHARALADALRANVLGASIPTPVAAKLRRTAAVVH